MPWLRRPARATAMRERLVRGPRRRRTRHPTAARARPGCRTARSRSSIRLGGETCGPRGVCHRAGQAATWRRHRVRPRPPAWRPGVPPRRRWRRHARPGALELQLLHLQAQPERVVPADIGAAVGVVADPGRERDGAGRQVAPRGGPGRGGRLQDRAGEEVDRVAAAGDGGDRLRVFLVEGDAGGPMRVAVSHRAGGPGRHRRELLVDGLRQREGRVRGEHRREARALDRGAEAGERHRAVVRVGTHQAGGELTRTRAPGSAPSPSPT